MVEACGEAVACDYNSVFSRLVLCKTFRLEEDGKVRPCSSSLSSRSFSLWPIWDAMSSSQSRKICINTWLDLWDKCSQWSCYHQMISRDYNYSLTWQLILDDLNREGNLCFVSRCWVLRSCSIDVFTLYSRPMIGDLTTIRDHDNSSGMKQAQEKLSFCFHLSTYRKLTFPSILYRAGVGMDVKLRSLICLGLNEQVKKWWDVKQLKRG